MQREGTLPSCGNCGIILQRRSCIFANSSICDMLSSHTYTLQPVKHLTQAFPSVARSTTTFPCTKNHMYSATNTCSAMSTTADPVTRPMGGTVSLSFSEPGCHRVSGMNGRPGPSSPVGASSTVPSVSAASPPTYDRGRSFQCSQKYRTLEIHTSIPFYLLYILETTDRLPYMTMKGTITTSSPGNVPAQIFV